ncbi:hypothetical protein [Mycobacterium sp. UM_CSW]|uniref:hypothetical protein n=1 Tax=Mycobacterium sp. UM_CSW TaxID=1370119 RepID=UPI000830CCFD|nr:hypothetical protein [Mycobacterium sp. UM_CSW]
MNEDKTPSTAAEIRALAEQAEAEAQEAEALAAAARARARAIQLRREAELAEAKVSETKQAATAEAVAAEEAADVTESVQPEASDAAPEVKADETETAEAEDTEAADTEEPVADADEAEAPVPAGRRLRLARRLRRPKWSTLAASVAIIVILVALAGSGYMIKEHRDAVRQRQRAAEFVAAARQGVVTLTSLDFNNAKQGVQRILENSTGTFKDDFLKMADDFTKVVEQSKVVSQGSVQAAAVELDSMTKDSAVVLVASTSEVTNAAGAKQDPRNYRLIVTVTRDGGQLKISKVEFVP